MSGAKITSARPTGTEKKTRFRLLDALLLGPGVGFLTIAMLVPAVQLLLASFGLLGLGQSGQLTLNNYTSIASNPLFTSAFRFSLLIALVTTALTIGIATAVSALLRTQVPGKRLITFLYKLPLVVPSLIAAFLVLTMIGPGGMLARLLIPWGIVWPDLLHNRWGTGIVIVLLWHSLPVSILIVSAVTASIPQDVYEAAKTLGASPWFVFRRITVPLCAPGIAAAALLVFIDCFGSYAVPSLIGPAFPRAIAVMMTAEFLLHANWGTASALGVVMITTTALVLVLYHRLTRSAPQGNLR